MKNNRKNRNKEKIDNRNKYRLKRTINAKAYSKIPMQLESEVEFIKSRQSYLISKCYSSAKRELKKWGLKNFHLKEIKIENLMCQENSDFVMDRFTLLVGVDYEIKFINQKC